EVGAVAAAPLLELGRRLGEHARAAAPVQAAPGAEQERHVEDPGPPLVGVVERDELVQVRRLGTTLGTGPGAGCGAGPGTVGTTLGAEPGVVAVVTRSGHRCALGSRPVAGEFDDIRRRLEAISEELADLAMERLRESIDNGGTELPVDERRLTRA